MTFHNYKELLKKRNSQNMPRHQNDNLADLFMEIIYEYRKENNGTHPTHVIVSAQTRIDLIKAFHNNPIAPWELDNDEGPEKLNGLTVCIVQSYHGEYLELI